MHIRPKGLQEEAVGGRGGWQGIAADDSMNVISESITNPISRTPDTFLLAI